MEDLTAPDSDGYIRDPRDTDVLCGRGGAALRHPGNQTYRKLVNLNKGLYITCLKTEKLKISRSIVAAIREQKGRFLEKDTNRGWFDIGDKKAVEKTSQALREGQPKLRQKMAEMGAAAVQANQMEQYASMQQQQQQQQELMPPPQQQQQLQNQLRQQHQQQQQQQIIRQRELLQQQANQASGGYEPQFQGSSQNSRGRRQDSNRSRQQDLHTDMLKRLTLQEQMQNQQGSQRSAGSSSITQQQQQQDQISRLRPSMNARASLARELGIAESQLSLMSDFSAYGGSITERSSAIGVPSAGSIMASASLASAVNESQSLMSVDSFKQALMGMPVGSINTLQASDRLSLDTASVSTGGASFMNQQQQNSGLHLADNSAAAAAAAAAAVNSNNLSNVDRRSVFAALKYKREPSSRSPRTSVTGASGQQSVVSGGASHFSDDIPDFHMLESNVSMFSNLSNITGLESKAASTGPLMEPVSVNLNSMSNNMNNRDRSNNPYMSNNMRSNQDRGSDDSYVNNNMRNNQDRGSNSYMNNNVASVTSNINSNMRGDPVRVPTNFNSGSRASIEPISVPTNFNSGSRASIEPINVPTNFNSGSRASSEPVSAPTNYNSGSRTSSEPVRAPVNFNSGSRASSEPVSAPVNFHGGSNFGAGGGVTVEKAKIVDHSSQDRGNLFGDLLSGGGSRRSIMSGLSRISDTSIDQSIFSDLSKKIGDVSTRSMAMSEMSAFDIDDIDEDDEENDMNPPTRVEGGPVARVKMDFDL